MIPTIDTLNFVLSTGGIALLGATAFLVFDYNKDKTLQPLVKKWGMRSAFLITIGGLAVTLVYSEVFGFVPCGLCWLQRVFLYPQIFIIGTSMYLKDKVFAPVYGIVLSSLGLIIALYQHYLQMGGIDIAGCPTTGEHTDCAERILFEYGFMTFPLLSAVLFLFLIVLYWYIYKSRD